MFRIVVQDSRRTPTSGKIVASLGHYDPHAKQVTVDKEKASFYLEHGAQPSDRIVRLLESEKVKLPDWVKKPSKQTKTTRNPEKLRKNQPAEPEKEEAPVAEAPVEAEEAKEEVVAEETPAAEPEKEEAPEETTEPAEAVKADEKPEDAPAE
jgi:small subunit ribosomal protein S16